MSSTDRPEGPEDESSPEHTYFQLIEERFIELRGAPLLLAPADWQVAREWYRQGIPVELVREALEQVFHRRQERGTSGRISSLRYCRAAVERSWLRLRELTAGGERRLGEPLLLEARLAALAAALPAGLGRRETVAARIRALAGTAEEVETELGRLDAELLVQLERDLDPAERERLQARVEESMARLGSRVPEEEKDRLRHRLTHIGLRASCGLPVLSLFAPEAEPANDGDRGAQDDGG